MRRCHRFELLLVSILLQSLLVLKALYDTLEKLIFLLLVHTASISWIKSVHKFVDEPRLLNLGLYVLLIAPILIVIKFWQVFAKSGLRNDFISSEVIAKLPGPIV